MIVDSFILLVALAIIAISADRFVLGAARTAELLNVPPLIVGIVIIGFGTGLPELMTAVVASLHNHPSLGISSALGSTVVNSTLVLGTLGVISAPTIMSEVLKREGLAQIVAVIAFVITITFFPNRLSYALLVMGLVIFISFILAKTKRSNRDSEFESEIQKTEHHNDWSLVKALVNTLLGLIFVLSSAELLIYGATGLAKSIGLSNALIGITIVALGTSLPELVTAIAAARRGQSDLVIGNIFGANLFNTTGVAGIAGLLASKSIEIPRLHTEVIFLVVISVLGWLLLSSGRRLSKPEGSLLIIVYLIWIAVVSI